MRKTKNDADQLRSNVFVFAIRIVLFLFYLNPKFQSLAMSCGCTVQFMSDLVGNIEDRFSHNEAHMVNRTSSSAPKGGN